MTNSQIIFNHQIELMKAGTIKTTGRMIEVVNAAGETLKIEEPEPIHTYAIWQQLGRQVKKGEKAKTELTIWKYTASKAKEETEEEAQEKGHCFLKRSFFFTLDQTEAKTK